MFYELRIEPKEFMSWEKIQAIIEEAFEKHGGLSAEGVEFINKD
jgi:hypothetical protein